MARRHPVEARRRARIVQYAALTAMAVVTAVLVVLAVTHTP